MLRNSENLHAGIVKHLWNGWLCREMKSRMWLLEIEKKRGAVYFFAGDGIFAHRATRVFLLKKI